MPLPSLYLFDGLLTHKLLVPTAANRLYAAQLPCLQKRVLNYYRDRGTRSAHQGRDPGYQTK